MYPSYDEWYERTALALRQSDIPAEYVEKFLADGVIMHKYYRDNAPASEVLEHCLQDYRADESAPPEPHVTLQSMIGAALFIAVGVVVLLWLGRVAYSYAGVLYWRLVDVAYDRNSQGVLVVAVLCAMAFLIVVVARWGGGLVQPRKK